MPKLPSLKIDKLPRAPKFRKLIGPSFIVLGLGLGSGELILWPYLASNYGLGIIWGAVLGITFQFFMNMEIERYSLINGESIFVGFKRKFKLLPLWFILSTFLPWIWPGIVGSAAQVIGVLIGISQTHLLAIALLILIGIILTLGPVLYKIQESLQKWFILLGAPIVFILAILLASQADWTALGQGIVGKGSDYWFLPLGIPMASFLAALAYSGAGGNLNLAQSYFVKEKGYGMGRFMGRITSFLTGKAETINLFGTTFDSEDKTNLNRFKKWWCLINLEHFLVFFLAGLVTILLLALLSFSTTFNLAGTQSGINFVFLEAQVIGQRLFPFIGTLFLIIVALMLFATHLSVLDATSRILAENFLLTFPRISSQKMRSLFYLLLWAQILTGICIFLFGIKEPLTLLTISAVLNAVAMFVHLGLTLWLNTTLLPQVLKPKFFRRLIMLLAFLFFGGFSLYTAYAQFYGQ